jgi:putative tryptophan/tyrosine transport system substrate-binding protein
MRRRELMALLGGAVLRPLAARAQQAANPVIGFLNTRAPNEDAQLVAAFRQGLTETGYVEGRNVVIEYRWAEGHNDRLPALAVDLVRRKVAVIAANSQATVAAKAATSTIPIVFVTGVDPVQTGFVASLNRPGGNLTGVTSMDTELGQKRLDLVHELLPKSKLIAFLINRNNPSAEDLSREVQVAARTIGQQVHILNAVEERDFDAAFATLVRIQADALCVQGDPFFNSRAEQLVRLAARYAVPVIYAFREYVTAGGLMSYGASITNAYRQLGVYTGRILKGEKPADLAIQQAMKVELIINLKTAKTLNLTIPQSILLRADEVIH